MYQYNMLNKSEGSSRLQIICVCILIMVIAITESAHAHKVNIFAYVEGDTVFTESYFNDGKKCVNSTVTVFDKQGNKLLEGKTDLDGLFSFKIPQDTDLRIVLTASMGHRAEYVLTKSEFLEATNATESNTVAKTSSYITDQGDSETSTGKIDITHLQSLIENSLDKKLAPIRKTLAKIEQDRGPPLVEVVGGIGYIFGIMGLAVFFKKKKNK